MSQEKRALSDRRAQARRVTEQVEISRQIAARTPLPKAKAVDNVKTASAQLDGHGANENDIEMDADEAEDTDDSAAVNKAVTKIDRSA
jgi:hypothetical protein